jgi:hypothetical protein
MATYYLIYEHSYIQCDVFFSEKKRKSCDFPFQIEIKIALIYWNIKKNKGIKKNLFQIKSDLFTFKGMDNNSNEH